MVRVLRLAGFTFLALGMSVLDEDEDLALALAILGAKLLAPR